MHYRPEIDGLRAIAVVPVILFHAGFALFAGGYVGVDIFFVISGYLITSIIASDIAAGKFSIVTFYERRARRILPALFFVMLASIPFAWMWLMPSDMRSFSQSLAAVAVFGSNILFWRTSGYFESAAELNPLLHTWSLAVEEQYYVIFPLFLLFAWSLGPRRVVLVLAGLAIASLTMSQALVTSHPAANFFLLPTRGWELAIGALIALRIDSLRALVPATAHRDGLGILGLLLITVAIAFFDEHTPFPGVYALLPTVGTGLLITYATDETRVCRLLSHKLLVSVGLASYSAYLWHQPVLALARHRALGEPGLAVTLGLLFLVAGLSFFSWKFVERPFRRKSFLTRRAIFLWALLGSLAFLGFGWLGHMTNGFENRLSEDRQAFLQDYDNSRPDWHFIVEQGLLEKNRYQCDFYDLTAYRSGYPTSVPRESIGKECYSPEPERERVALIWGDSHARHIYYGLRKTLPEEWEILQVTSSGCPARLGASPSRNDYCKQSNWFAEKTIKEVRPHVVIVAQDRNHRLDRMTEIRDQLVSYGVKRVIFLGPSPHWQYDLPKVVAFKLWENTGNRSRVGLDSDALAVDRDLQAGFPASERAEYVSLTDYFCNEDGCLVYLGDDRRTSLTSWDYGHLTPLASLAFSRDVLAGRLLRLPD